jgi:glutamyl-tRNA reductase
MDPLTEYGRKQSVLSGRLGRLHTFRAEHEAKGAVMNGSDIESGRDTVERDIPPTVASLQQSFESLRRSEFNRIRRRLGKLSQDQESAIDSLTRAIVTKILDAPISILKVASAESDSVALIEVVHRIFNLGDAPKRAQPMPQT